MIEAEYELSESFTISSLYILFKKDIYPPEIFTVATPPEEMVTDT